VEIRSTDLAVEEEPHKQDRRNAPLPQMALVCTLLPSPGTATRITVPKYGHVSALSRSTARARDEPRLAEQIFFRLQCSSTQKLPSSTARHSQLSAPLLYCQHQSGVGTSSSISAFFFCRRRSPLSLLTYSSRTPASSLTSTTLGCALPPLLVPLAVPAFFGATGHLYDAQFPIDNCSRVGEARTSVCANVQRQQLHLRLAVRCSQQPHVLACQLHDDRSERPRSVFSRFSGPLFSNAMRQYRYTCTYSSTWYPYYAGAPMPGYHLVLAHKTHTL
jgi:hypothetical protein